MISMSDLGVSASEEILEEGASVACVTLYGPAFVLVAGHDVYVLDVNTVRFKDSMLVRQEYRGKVLVGLLARALRARDAELYLECRRLADYIRGAEVKEKYLPTWEHLVARCNEEPRWISSMRRAVCGRRR